MKTLVLCSVLLLYRSPRAVKLEMKDRSSMSTTSISNGLSRPDREIRRAWQFFAGTFVALILNGIWSMIVGTASPGADESDLIQGWEGVLRNFPAYLLLVVVASLSVWFATQGGEHGSRRAKSALVASSLVLLFALSAVTRDVAEVVMTTRAATVAWVMFGVDAVLVVLVYVVAKQRIRHALGR